MSLMTLAVSSTGSEESEGYVPTITRFDFLPPFSNSTTAAEGGLSSQTRLGWTNKGCYRGLPSE
jgi:hypothetical protein